MIIIDTGYIQYVASVKLLTVIVIYHFSKTRSFIEIIFKSQNFFFLKLVRSFSMKCFASTCGSSFLISTHKAYGGTVGFCQCRSHSITDIAPCIQHQSIPSYHTSGHNEKYLLTQLFGLWVIFIWCFFHILWIFFEVVLT